MPGHRGIVVGRQNGGKLVPVPQEEASARFHLSLQTSGRQLGSCCSSDFFWESLENLGEVFDHGHTQLTRCAEVEVHSEIIVHPPPG